MTCITVTGLHRGGTSCVAGMLYHLGVKMGIPGITKGDTLKDGWPLYPSNPKGQFEDNGFVSTFSSMIGNWRNPDPKYLHNMNSITSTDQFLLSLLVENRLLDAGGQVWGIKTPQLCFTFNPMAFVLGTFKQEHIAIFVFREFESCIDSLVERDGMPRGVAEHIISRYYIAREHHLSVAEKRNISTIVVDYDNLMDNDIEGRTKVVNKFVKYCEIPASAAQISAAVDSIDSSMRHHVKAVCHDVYA